MTNLLYPFSDKLATIFQLFSFSTAPPQQGKEESQAGQEDGFCGGLVGGNGRFSFHLFLRQHRPPIGHIFRQTVTAPPQFPVS